jgi:hypothetical protein
MKYEAPLGQSDPNAPYINANKAAGISGSIPPAESIEYPQREIVNLITKTGITPSDADLFQMTRGIRRGKLNYQVDVGTANALAISNDPPLTAYHEGMRLYVKAAHSCIGPGCVITCDSLPERAVKRADGAELAANDYVAGQIVCLVDDGTEFQMQNWRGVGGGTGGGTTNYVVNIPYCRDTSATANLVVASYTPAITALVEGMPIEVMVKNATTGPTQINVNALPVRKVVHGDGSDLGPGDGYPGMIWLLFWDSVNWQLVNARGTAGAAVGPPSPGSGKSLQMVSTPYITFFNRTPTISGNRTMWTMSMFMKRTSLSDNSPQVLIAAGPAYVSGGQFTGTAFNHYGGSADIGRMTAWWADLNPLPVYGVDIYGGMHGWFAPQLIFQDSNWHHWMWQANGSQLSCYYDGILVAQGAVSGNSSWNQSGQYNIIGCESSPDLSVTEFGTNFKIAELYFVDGVALPWNTFATIVSGAVIPQVYSGPWGNNGWYLNWSDSGNIGKDWSGMNNDWTPHNITAGLISNDYPPG